MPTDRSIVIIGAGIIGCTAAYYITRHPNYSQENTTVVVLEASSVAAGASGKAGGLIAKWAFPKELVKVAFPEHERLARQHNGSEKWGFRYVECGQWVGRGEEVLPTDAAGVPTELESPTEQEDLHDSAGACQSGLPEDLDWVPEHLTDSYEPMARPGETAQVHPYYFTNSMLELAQERGAQLVMGRATGLEYTGAGTDEHAVTGVVYVDEGGTEQTLPATDVIIAAGPWTSRLIPNVPIRGTRAHSITIRPTRPVSAYALFTEITLPPDCTFRTSDAAPGPEIFARPNNEVYASSSGDGEPLPDTAAEVKVVEETCDLVFKQVAAISPELRGGEVLVKQACYLPNVTGGPKGCPIVGPVDGTKGLIIASGHTCWGIVNAPGTAKALAELILDGKITCGKFDRLAPRMFQ